MSRQKGTPNKPKSEAEKELKKAVIKQLETNGWITEKKGSKNKTKVVIDDYPSGNDKPMKSIVVESQEKFIHGIKEEKQDELPAYLVVQANDINSLNQVVRAEMACYKYVCQGGVSVTNYRGLDGKIVMVYCQAMVRREG